ncbi:MAG: rhomboid family intramembrane serine protease [Planctomycetota bacterium]
MRRIGQTQDQSSAQRLCDYLETQSIDAKPDADTDAAAAHDIWIRDERDVDAARSILDEFLASPSDPKFNVTDEAKRLRLEREKSIREKVKQQEKARQRLRGRGGVGGGQTGSIPVTIAVIVLSTLASFSTSFGRLRGQVEVGNLTLEQKIFFNLSCVDPIEYKVTGNQFASLQQGQVWRLVTPMFLHGATFHLAFNMMALFTLGSVVERIHGSVFLAGLLLVSQIGATLLQMSIPELPLLQLLREGPIAIGASGAVFGVFGFIWIRPRFQQNYPVEIPQINVTLMLGFLVACFTPLIPGIANGAHLGGLLIGIAIARFWPREW